MANQIVQEQPKLIPVLLQPNTYDIQIHSNFPKIDSDTKCNGKVHRQLRYCKKPAGWGTKHFGNGRCKLHGGCSTGRKSGNLRYSDFVPSSIVEKYEEFSVEDDKEIKSLDNEIALIRAKITGIENINQKGEFDGKICQMVELVRRLAESKQKIEEGIKQKIEVEIVHKVIDSVIKIIDDTVPDIEMKKRIAVEMRRLNLSELCLN